MAHSSAAKNRVPICTPHAPKHSAAAMAWPDPIPPAAITGISTACTTWGKVAMVDVIPMWPPASWPSHTTASTPKASIFLACLTAETTGITLMPSACKSWAKSFGVPAPVKTMAGFSSLTTSNNSGILSNCNIKLTPKGLSVRRRIAWMSARKPAASTPTEVKTPRPPALLTALTNSGLLIRAIPPWIIGYWVPKRSVKRLSIILSSSL